MLQVLPRMAVLAGDGLNAEPLNPSHSTPAASASGSGSETPFRLATLPAPPNQNRYLRPLQVM